MVGLVIIIIIIIFDRQERKMNNDDTNSMGNITFLYDLWTKEYYSITTINIYGNYSFDQNWKDLYY